MSRLKILLTNDDGIDSTGLRYLWEALRDVGELTVVAPNKERSGAGVGVTVMEPLRVEPVDTYAHTPAWKIGGTPADCVKLAISALLDSPPDLIVSGINHGSNAGRNVLYSGTIGGIIEGVLRGIPGIAFSYACIETPTFPHVKPFIPQIVDYIKNHPLPFGSFLNVNFPHIDGKEIKGFKMARQGKSYWMEAPEYNIEPKDGYSEYWMGGVLVDHEEHDHSDIALLDQGYITATPIHVNELTDQHYFTDKKAVFEQELNKDSLRV